MVDTQVLRKGSVMRPLPPGSVPVGAPMTEAATKEDAQKLENPVPTTEFSRSAGKRLFRVNCYPCHGDIGAVPYVPGPVSKFVPGPNLSEGEYYTTMPPGRIYGTMMFGGMALMPRVGWKLSPEEKWHIVNYVRFAQQEVQKQKGSATSNQKPEPDQKPEQK